MITFGSLQCKVVCLGDYIQCFRLLDQQDGSVDHSCLSGTLQDDSNQEYCGGGSRKPPSLMAGLGAALRFRGIGLAGIRLMMPADINGSLGLIGLLGPGDLVPIEARLMTPMDSLA